LLTHNAPCPPINKGRQLLHTNGTPGKDQFYSHVDADNLTKQAWEMGTPYYDKNEKLRGKLFDFGFKIGTNKAIPSPIKERQ
jgi:hypothetical protein